MRQQLPNLDGRHTLKAGAVKLRIAALNSLLTPDQQSLHLQTSVSVIVLRYQNTSGKFTFVLQGKQVFFIRHNENYRDTTVSPGAKKWSLFVAKTNDLPDSTCHLG